MRIPVEIHPSGARLLGRAGEPLRDILARAGVEFPCGGRGTCRGCRIRALRGEIPETPSDVEILTPEERRDGWRLACRGVLAGPLMLEVRQLDLLVLSDDRPFAFDPAEGLGVAVDLGTTTLVAQLLDLATGRVRATSTALNPQAKLGADIMSRVREALAPDGLRRLSGMVRSRLREMVDEVLHRAGEGAARLRRIVVVGNTVMQHLFLGRRVDGLAASPFESPQRGGARMEPAEAGWEGLPSTVELAVLPNLGGFVGSDILAAILTTELHRSEAWVGAADLGTNGEVVLGRRGKIYAASTAAGPAFEGGRILMGMRAGPGAIDEVTVREGALAVRVIGGGTPRGLCGSGLVDAVACGLELGRIDPSGRMRVEPWTLAGSVSLAARDVRELQLAKGAICAGIRALCDEAGVPPARLERFHLAGAFGNALCVRSAVRIGLLPVDPSAVAPAGNAALRGAKMCLFFPEGGRRLWEEVLPVVEHVPLASRPDFADLFAEAVAFPDGGREAP